VLMLDSGAFLPVWETGEHVNMWWFDAVTRCALGSGGAVAVSTHRHMMIALWPRGTQQYIWAVEQRVPL